MHGGHVGRRASRTCRRRGRVNVGCPDPPASAAASTPSPLSSGEKRAELATARERAGVKGRERCHLDVGRWTLDVERPTSNRGALLARPPALSPDYRGEGTKAH